MKISTKLMILVLACIAACVVLILNDCPWWALLFGAVGVFLVADFETAASSEMNAERKKG